MFLNDTACNLASLNLMKFVGADGEFDVEAYRFAAKVTITAQEILVDNASYPTPRIEENSHKFRPLGLGYANLGALLMSRGLAYDSRRGPQLRRRPDRDHARRGVQASRPIIARDHGGPFVAYDENREPFLRVIGKHRDAAYRIPTNGVPQDAARATRPPSSTRRSSSASRRLPQRPGHRPRPTGTIAFMMDCDTTGVEPDIALIKYKKLVGEGFLKIVNQTVPAALRKLGYGAEEVDEILAYLTEHETIEGAPHLKPQHLPVFDCAFKPANGERSIHYMGHVRMMGAIQPFISRRDQQDRQHARGRHGRGDREGLPRGLEARPQGDRGLPRQLEAQPAAQSPARRPATSGADAIDSEEVEKLRKQLAKAQVEAGLPHRRRLPAERSAVTHKFDIAGHEGYITVGLYPDGQPGEIFLKMAKEGSTVSGLMDTFATTGQRGAPVRRAAQGPRQQVRPRPVRAVAASPATRRSRSPSRSWTTSSAGSARASCPPRTRSTSASSDRVVGRRGAGRRLRSHSAAGPRASAARPPAVDARSRELGTRAAQGHRVRRPQGDRGRRRTGRRRAAEPLAVIATNGALGNGHAANGNGKTDERERRRLDGPDHPEPRRHQGQLPDPGRRPQLLGLRLDHGPQRQSCYKCLNCGSTSGCS